LTVNIYLFGSHVCNEILLSLQVFLRLPCDLALALPFSFCKVEKLWIFGWPICFGWVFQGWIDPIIGFIRLLLLFQTLATVCRLDSEEGSNSTTTHRQTCRY
jgi:hypothetical protein